MTMKENIQVNLFGTIYHMDKDAYELLKKYEDNMRQYFSRREDGDEIADDIEHRVAELIEDLRQNGTEAITIEHVEDIIRRIGRPEDLPTRARTATAPRPTARTARPARPLGGCGTTCTMRPARAPRPSAAASCSATRATRCWAAYCRA